METYTINGHSFEYDTFDVENVELFDNEINRIKSLCAAGNGISHIRPLCEAIMDMFDQLIGDGTSEIAFDGRMNVKEILEAFETFSSDVVKAVNGIGGLNKDQKRARRSER